MVDVDARFKETWEKASFYLDRLDERLTYHNKGHTERVVEAGKQLFDEYRKSDAAANIHEEELGRLESLINVATAFHDTGFSQKDLSGNFVYSEAESISGEKVRNEEMGAFIATRYMEDSDLEYTSAEIEMVRQAIIKTDLSLSEEDREPKNIVEAIMQDADLAIVGRDFGEITFIQTGEDLRQEWKNVSYQGMHSRVIEGGDLFEDKAFGAFQKKFVEDHKWRTEEAKKLYSEGQQRNIQRVISHYGLSS